MGRAEFDRQSVIRSLPGRASRLITINNTASIPAGGNLDIDIYATSGTVAEVVDALVTWSATAGATSGSRSLICMGSSGTAGLLAATFPYNATQPVYNYGMAYDNGAGAVAPSTLRPSDATAFAARLRGVIFDDTVFLRWAIRNTTDIADTGARNIYLIVTEEDVS